MRGAPGPAVVLLLLLLSAAALAREDNSAGSSDSSAVIEIIAYNATVAPGAVWVVEWRVVSGDSGQVAHTNVHWGRSPGTIADDYPNNGAPQSGSLPGMFADQGLVAPLVPGTLYIRVHARWESAAGSGENVSDQFIVLVEHPVKSSAPGVHLVDSPTEPVEPGGNVTVTWQVVGGKPGNVTHTNVHWGTKPGDHPSETSEQIGVTPQTFTVQFQAPSSNTEVFFVIHAIVDISHVYSLEHSFRVGPNPIAEITWADHHPRNVPAGSQLTVRWRVEGGIPGAIHRTWVAWDTSAAVLNQRTGDQSGDTKGGTIAVEFTESNITVPAEADQIYYQPVAEVDGKRVDFRIRNASVTGGSNVFSVLIDAPPPRIEAGTEFAVSWKVHGGRSVDVTRFEYGFESGVPKFKGNEFLGKPDQLFPDIIRAPDRQGRVYYQVYFRVDGQDFTSPESSFFVFDRGAGANWGVIGAMGALVLLLIVLVILLMRQQGARKETGPQHIVLDDAKGGARRWLAARYGTDGKSFRFHDAYQLEDGYDVVFESRHGTFKYRVRVDNANKVRRFSGGR